MPFDSLTFWAKKSFGGFRMKIIDFKIPSWIILSLLIVSSLKAAWDFFWRLSVEFHAPVTGDAFTFLAMGRAILNGYIPYRDLMEIKPPGMFLISALSMYFGDEKIAWALQLLVLILTPFLVIFLCQRFKISALAGWIMGVAYFLYIVKAAARFETESFGVFFCLLYLLSSTVQNKYWRIGLCSVTLLAAIGLKEPFLLSIIAAVLILAQRKNTIQTFIISFAIAATLGLILMASLGYLQPYFTLYLPTMIFERAQSPQTDYGVFFRGLFVIRLVKDITWFSPAPIFGCITCLLWLLFPSWGSSTKMKVLSVAGMSLAFYSWEIAAWYWQLIIKLNGLFPWQDSFFRSLTLQYSLVSLACVGLFIFIAWKDRALFWRMLIGCLALYIMVFDVGIGNFLLNHYLFAVPFYVALFLTCRNNIWILLIISLVPFFHPAYSYEQKLLEATIQRQGLPQQKAIAQKIDKIMDQCGFQRYFNLEDSAPVAFTKHSPLNFQWDVITALQWNHNVKAREALFKKLNESSVFFVRKEFVAMWKDDELTQFVASLKTTIPCAKGIEFDGGDIQVLYQDIHPTPITYGTR